MPRNAPARGRRAPPLRQPRARVEARPPAGRETGHAAAIAVLVAAATLQAACGIVGRDFFNEDGGSGGRPSASAGRGAGGAGGAGGGGGGEEPSASTSGAGTSSSSASAGSTSASSSVASTSSSTATSSTTGGGFCGDGVCNEDPAFCPQDCGGGCVHTVCQAGDPLTPGCDPCVGTVCAADPYCCEQGWDGQCISEAEDMCGAMCCGDGICDGESCESCPADCGACQCGDGECDGETCQSCPADCGQCPQPAECPHTVCFLGGPLDPMKCADPCVDEVCAMKPECCSNGNDPNWEAPCQELAKTLCGPNPCITKICAADASCCSSGWTQKCIDLAKANCNTTCDCAHSVCQSGEKLVPTCNPCAEQICLADAFCCNSAWDTICVGEVQTVCGIDCNSND